MVAADADEGADEGGGEVTGEGLGGLACVAVEVLRVTEDADEGGAGGADVGMC